MIMIPNGPGQKNSYVDFIRLLKELVGEGKVPQSRIDDAVQRILVVKFQMGLFDHPYAAPELMAEFGSAAHREVARQCVRESLVLLRNRKNALPLSKTIHRLAVVGAAANDLGTQCGGWTISWQGRTGTVTPGGTTILKALRQTTGKDTKVTFAPEAGKVAGADAVLVVIGEKPYAEMKGDRADLRLNKADAALIASAKAHAGAAPVIVLLLSGRPLVLGSALDTSDAFIAAWLPGTEGQGVADVLFGDYKPTGKLPRAWPRSNEQAATAGLRDPQFPFGFGLTY
jgi:beta-glucosidase